MPHDIETIHRISRKYGLRGEPVLLPPVGMVNEAWSIGEQFILRIVREEKCDNETAIEAYAVPLARNAGVRTPELIAIDFDRDIVPRPYSIYKRAPGVLLGHVEVDPATLGDLYFELGRECALMHSVEVSEEGRAILDQVFHPNVEKQLASSLRDKVITESEAEQVRVWTKRVSEYFGEVNDVGLIHRDIHPWNMFVDPETLELSAIIDWGDAAYGDPSIEFANMPLVAVKPMLAGYAEAGGEVSEALISRSIVRGFTLMVWEIRCCDENFLRQWWRFPVSGWEEAWRSAVELLPSLAQL